MLNQQIHNKLKHIADRIAQGNCSVIIGSGFSKNAESIDKNTPEFPDWNELKKAFEVKLNTKENYNPITLASMVENEFGRPTLEEIVKNNIPDKSFIPGAPHLRLLELGWNKVFTTNYDTLLEQTNKTIGAPYKVVKRKEEIPLSGEKTIIKLHGCIESGGMIISENDYESYPDKNKSLETELNSCIQKNVICLIGFSGEDPNFKNTHYWLRKSLGKYASEIYLFSIKPNEPAYQNFLESKSIETIDLSVLFKKYDSISEGFEKLFEIFLKTGIQKISEPNIEESLSQKWPNEKMLVFWTREGNIRKQMLEIKNEWKLTRTNAPKLYIQDFNKRILIRDRTIRLEHLLKHLDNLENQEDICILFEFDWRLNLVHLPILTDWENAYQTLIDKYLETINKEDSHFEKFISIFISFIRYLRENGKLEKVKTYFNLIGKFVITNEELSNRIYNEKAIYFLWEYDFENLNLELNKWEVKTDNVWTIKKAKILSQIGKIDEALKLLSSFYDFTNNELNNPNNDYYAQLSKLTYDLILYNSKILSVRKENTLSFQNSTKETPKPINENIFNIYDEINTFNLSHQPIIETNESSKRNFDLTTTITYGAFDNEFLLRSISFLRLFEECGLSYSYGGFYTLGMKELRNAIFILNQFNLFEYQQLIYCLHFGDEKFIDIVYTRKLLVYQSQESLDKFTDFFLNIYYKMEQNSELQTILDNSTVHSNFHKVLPEILSRTSSKSSLNILKKLSQFYLNAANSNNTKYLGRLNKLSRRLITVIPQSEHPNIFKKFLESSLLKKSKTNQLDIFKYLEVDKSQIQNFKKTKISNFAINRLIQKVTETGLQRANAISTLYWLYKLEKLSEVQIKVFLDSLFLKTDSEYSLPISTGYYHFFSFEFAAYLPKQVRDNISKYIIKGNPEIQGLKENKKNFQLGHTQPWIENMIGLGNEKYSLSKKEINNIASKCIEWWTIDKEFLDHEYDGIFGSIKDDFRENFSRMYMLFNHTLAPNFSILYKTNIKGLEKVIIEMKTQGFFILEFELRLTYFNGQNTTLLIQKVSHGLNSMDNLQVSDALNALDFLVKKEPEKATSLLLEASTFLRFRKSSIQNNYYHFFTFVANEFPKTLDGPVLKNLFIALKETLDHSSYKDTDNDETIISKILQKRNAAKLASALNNSCHKKANKVLEDWLLLKKDPNEFAEVRNSFS